MVDSRRDVEKEKNTRKKRKIFFFSERQKKLGMPLGQAILRTAPSFRKQSEKRDGISNENANEDASLEPANVHVTDALAANNAE